MRGAWLLVAVVGCAPSIELDLAAVHGANAAVLVAHVGSDIIWARVLEPSGEPFGLPARFDRLSIAYSRSTIEELGLHGGEIDLAAARASLAHYGFDVQRVWLDGDWAAAEPLEDWLATTLLLPPRIEPDRCALPWIRRVAVPALSIRVHPVAFRGSVLLFGDAGEVFRVGPDLVVTKLHVEGTRAPSTAAVAVDDVLWLAIRGCIEAFDLHGDVLTPERGSPRCSPLLEAAHWMDSKDGARFLVSNGFRQQLVTASTITGIGEYRVATMDGGGTVWAASDAKVDSFTLAGERRSEPVALAGAHPTALDWQPSLGLMLGDANGRVLRRRGGRWETFETPGSFSGVTSFAPWHGGFVVGDGTAAGARYIEGRGFCPLVWLGTSGTMVPLGDGLLIASRRDPPSRELWATWFAYYR